MISVLLPVHNAEPYLGLALDSFLEQTFQDFEIIAINDGSTDLSGQILDEYASRNSCIRVFHRPQRGLIATLNEGIELARGEWIARMDADDIAVPNRLELQLEQLLRTGADFCGGAVQCFGDSNAIWRYPESNEGCGVRLLFGVPVAHPAVIGRTSALITLRYDPRFKHAEDYELWQRAWNAGYRFTNCLDIVLHYRVHEKQVSFIHSLEQEKMADAVRGRHWKHLCPVLEKDWFDIKVSKFNRGEGNAVSLIEGMLKVLTCIPQNVHNNYLIGCLGIFLRVSRRDPRSVFYWVRLYNSTSSHSWGLKLNGSLKLVAHAIFRFNPEGSSYAWLRTIWKKFVLR